MGNVLDREKQHQILALGRVGWSLRQIEDATGVRRETASRYLKAAGVAVRRPGRWGHSDPKAAIAVITDAGPPPELRRPGRSPSASACEPYRELVESGIAQGRNAMSMWQDLVDDHGFAHGYQSVRRFVVTLRGEQPLEAHPSPTAPVWPLLQRSRVAAFEVFTEVAPKLTATSLPSRSHPNPFHPSW